MKNGFKNGFGNITFPNGNSYEGQWKDDLKFGYGKYIWNVGTKIDHDIINGFETKKNQLLETHMKDNGKKTKNQEMEHTFGRMEINMLEHLKMT